MNVAELRSALRGLDDQAEVWLELEEGEDGHINLDVLGEVRMENSDLHLVAFTSSARKE